MTASAALTPDSSFPQKLDSWRDFKVNRKSGAGKWEIAHCNKNSYREEGAWDTRSICGEIGKYLVEDGRNGAEAEAALLRACAAPNTLPPGNRHSHENYCAWLAKLYLHRGSFSEALAAASSPGCTGSNLDTARGQAACYKVTAAVYENVGDRIDAIAELRKICSTYYDTASCRKLQNFGYRINMAEVYRLQSDQEHQEWQNLTAARQQENAQLQASEAEHEAKVNAIFGALNDLAASNNTTDNSAPTRPAPSYSRSSTTTDSGSTGGWTGARYSGPDSSWVRGLLSRSPSQWSCPHSRSERPTAMPIQPRDLPCMRDSYAWAALLQAWGAECHAELGMETDAEKNASEMMTYVKTVKKMCSKAPAVAGGSSCSTLTLIPCP